MMPDKSTSENSEDEFANGNSEDNCPIIWRNKICWLFREAKTTFYLYENTTFP